MNLAVGAKIIKAQRNCDKKVALYTTFCTDKYIVKSIDNICKLELSEMTVLGLATAKFYDRPTREVSIVNQSAYYSSRISDFSFLDALKYRFLTVRIYVDLNSKVIFNSITVRFLRFKSQ